MRTLPLLFALVACGGSDKHHDTHAHPHGHGHHSFSNAEEWAKKFDDPARDAWQKPNDVIAALSLSPAMTVADVGAGTGYFAFRLARSVPQGAVIAQDLEPDMVRYLGERATREGITNVRAVQGAADDPALPARAVDRILVVDVWHHVEDRVAFARKLVASLRDGGQVAIVDFKRDATMGPPPAMRLAPDVVIDELNRAGLEARLAPTVLPQQYIVIGTLP